MIIFNEKDNKEFEIDFSGTVKEMLERLGMNRESVIVVVNDEIVDDDEEINNNDKVRILSVVSGG